MKAFRLVLLNLVGFGLLFNPAVSYAQNDSKAVNARAILLNPVIGKIHPDQPKTVNFRVLTGPAKNCILSAKAHLDPHRLRHIYQLSNNICQIDGQNILLGGVVRGQHNIVGTMANSGMGRRYLISNKGVEVTLSVK
ncbi:hypothetical protein [Thiomicrorhabdus sediminis]|uniref:Uncharacterized protein n=1 Tax=Thiomicrorhabdus sediminis TaxID=2580412 RepID=A0A4P9K9G0_9GAMM|nr:hypothetical protein [Thiomicrorhabdus sediminis]QCU90967.1 hypothetical protein FE785_10180 [Thiomicrorhabdus sediminis]